MIVCPQCGKKQTDGNNQCEACGYNFQAAKKTVVMDKPTKQLEKESEATAPLARKPIYKRPTVIISALLIIALLVALGIFLYLINAKQATYKQSISNIWDDVITSSNSFKDSLAKTKDVDDFNQLANANSDHSAVLKDKLVEAKVLNSPSAYKKTQKKLEKALQRYIDYLTEAQTIMEEPLKVEIDVDFIELSSLASEAKLACQEVVDSTDFIEEDVPLKVFNMPSILRPIVKEAQQKEQEEKQEEKERKKKQQEEAEKQAAEDTVEGWMKALKDQDISAMSNYMTTEAYERIRPEDFEGDYIIEDYKITQTDRISLTKFEVRVTEYDQWSSGERTTTTRLFSVVKVGDNWLIDEQHTLY